MFALLLLIFPKSAVLNFGVIHLRAAGCKDFLRF